MFFTALEALFILRCAYVSFYGIWTRKGINKQIRNQIFIKQTVWLGYRFINAACHAYIFYIILSQYIILQIYHYQYPEIVKGLDELYRSYQDNPVLCILFYIDAAWGFLFVLMYIVDPDFRIVVYEMISRSSSEKRSIVELNKEKAKTFNNFLFSSLNLQSVCSILSGIK